MSKILVIGGASSDTLYFAGQQADSAGGAGMYTAMAARRCGAQVDLYAPRPDPMPHALRPVADRLTAWHGPVVSLDQLAHFEIVHEAGKTTYLQASVGAESDLTPDDLPADLSAYDCIHIIPLGDGARQLAFLKACQARGARRIAVGTALDIIMDKPDAVREIMGLADDFFMNEKEAAALFGSVENAHTRPGKLLFVTLGASGARVIQGDYPTDLPGVTAHELDPTGAGDTFCGATLSFLVQGLHPVMAARAALPLAAQMIEHIGPTALFWAEPPPSPPLDARVTIDPGQIERIARMAAELPEVAPFNFTGHLYPPVGHPAALDLFFASTLQQFSFWSTAAGRYEQPLIAPISGVLQKGSSYLFQSYLRRLEVDPDEYTPARQAQTNEQEMLLLFRADDGTDPMPALDLHLAQAQAYGRDMLALDLTPGEIIRRAQASPQPLREFLGMLDHIGGYKEDPLRKKSSLLALILNQRSEKFLPFGPGEQLAPVIDYHLMRSCLRTGLVTVVDPVLRNRLVGRWLLDPADEWAVRYAAYHAVEKVCAQSGKSMGAVDWFFFNARKRCPEMTEPDCEACPVNPVCAMHKELFQPVIRTTFY